MNAPTPSLAHRRTRLEQAVLALAFLVFPALFLHHYRVAFGYDSLIVPFGTGLVAAAFAALWTLFLLLGAAVPPGSRRAVRRLFAGCLAALVIGLGAVYLAAYASNEAWGDALSIDIVATFARDPKAVLDFMPLSAPQKWNLLALLVLASAVLVCGALALARLAAARLFHPLAGRLAAGAGLSRGRRAAVFAVLVGAIALLAAGIGTTVQQAPARIVGEPVSSFFKLFAVSDATFMDAHRWKAAFDDAAARAAYPKTPAFRRKNVVLILADSLRADRMSVYGYARQTTPFLDELHAQGRLHRVDLALSTCSESYCGIASTLASRPFHEVSDKNFKLHSLLKDLGYRVNFLVAGDHRSWRYVYDFYGRDIDLFHDHSVDREHAINDDRKVLSGLSRLPAADGQPQFFYLFLMSGHVAGTRLPEFARWQPEAFDNILAFWNEAQGTQRTGGTVSKARQLDRQELAVLSNRYDNGVLQTDAMLRRIFALLDDKGYLKDSIVVILADHGDGLGEHGHVGHTRYLYQEDIGIPLLVYDADPAAYRNGRFATNADVAPTIVDRLGLPVPSTWQGRSLLRPPAQRITLHQTRRGANLCRAVVEDQGPAVFKYIRCGTQPGRVTEEMYELKADPRERDNLLATAPSDLRQRLARELDSRFGVTVNRCQRFECLD